MDTSYELLKVTKIIKSGNKEAIVDFINMTIDDLYFQSQFVVCSDDDTSRILVAIYTNVVKHIFMLDNPNEVSDWLNTMVSSRTADWLKKSRREMLQAEKRNAYPVPNEPNVFTTGNELENSEYTKIIINSICNIPEIHRQTALAYYYNNMSFDKMSEEFLFDEVSLKTRVAYIEKTLNIQMQQICKNNGVKAIAVTSQKIRSALCELSKLYHAPDKDIIIQGVGENMKR